MDKSLPIFAVVRNSSFFAKHPLFFKLLLIFFLTILLLVVGVIFAPLQIWKSGFLFSSVSPKLGFIDQKLDGRFMPMVLTVTKFPDGSRAYVIKGTFDTLDVDEKGKGILQVTTTLGNNLKLAYSNYTTRVYWTDASLNHFPERFTDRIKVLNDSYYPSTTMLAKGYSYLRKGDMVDVYIYLDDISPDNVVLSRHFFENVQKMRVAVIVAGVK